MLTIIQDLTVEAMMSTKISQIDPDQTIYDALVTMNTDGVNELIIGSTSKPVGIITVTDITRSNVHLPNDLSQPLHRQFLRELVTIHPKARAEEARNIMREHGIGRLPVIQDGVIVGIVRTIDIMTYYYQEIEQIRNTYIKILDEIHEGVCVVDRDGIVVTWSNHSARLYKIPPEEILHRPIDEKFPSALLRQVLQTGKAVDNTIHSPRKGTVVNISAAPLYNQGELIGAISTDRDITDVMNLTNELADTRNRLEFLQDEVAKLSETAYNFDAVIGTSSEITDVIKLAATVAPTNSSILITGESGTGKELFARSIHAASGRNGLFVPINCSAIPESLFESEMFGYAAGAFTGALNEGKVGKFELANNGTLFLDEIGDMPLSMQAKMLRVIQDKVITRIGDNQLIKTNVRIISATHRDLKELVDQGKFREDLFYRLNVVALDIPSLKERAEDIPLFVQHYLQEFSHDNMKPIKPIDSGVIEQMMRYSWPGNIRELRNVVEQMVIFADERLTIDLLPVHIRRSQDTTSSNRRELASSAADLEQMMIEKALKEADGNKARAARILGISRPTLYYKLSKYNLDV
ncbi:MAG: sigma 54-interacting transcriptional regulator [Tissierellia bacterium]|nr:sigma 54-interacting transcriptional regulator [Tissierellia bacterium]